MQNICKEKLNWDDMLSQKLLKDWHDCLTKLEKIGSIKTHGRFEIGNNTNPVVTREFHGFCDASLNGYGVCIYVKTIYKSGEISVKLLSSKSRVAPLKQETIPRLELLGALLLSRLMLSVRNSLKDERLFDNVYYWCDLQIALAWIKSTNKEFRTFTENRVTEIRKHNIIENWHYCKTMENPSNLITRKQIIDLRWISTSAICLIA